MSSDNVMISAFFKSISYIAMISTVFSGVLTFISTVAGLPAWAVFFGCFIATIFLQLIINSLIEKEIIINEMPDNVLNIPLSCAFCNVKSEVFVSLDEDNTYVCPHCNQTNKFFVQFSTARITTPLVNAIDGGKIDLDGGMTDVQTPPTPPTTQPPVQE